MQVRILSLRSASLRSSPTLLSRGLQSVSASLGATEEVPEDTRVQQGERFAELQAMNARLAELGCKTYDLEAELQQTDPGETPRPR